VIEILVERLKEVLKEKTREKNKKIIKVVEKMKKIGVRNLKRDEWKIKENLVLKEGKVYILENEKITSS